MGSVKEKNQRTKRETMNELFMFLEEEDFVNLKLLQEVAQILKKQESKQMAIRCYLRIIEVYPEYYLECSNQLLNIFEVERHLLSKLIISR